MRYVNINNIFVSLILLEQICKCIGEILLSQCPGANPSEYIPLYLQKITKMKKNQVRTCEI